MTIERYEKKNDNYKLPKIRQVFILNYLRISNNQLVPFANLRILGVTFVNRLKVHSSEQERRHNSSNRGYSCII